MIEIKYVTKEHKLVLKGHANSNEKGKDLICCACSTLFFTLAQALTESQKAMDNFKWKYKDGYGEIFCKPKKEYEGNISRTVWTVLVGFEMLENNYPKFLKFICEY